jgi:hypothetical protein
VFRKNTKIVNFCGKLKICERCNDLTYIDERNIGNLLFFCVKTNTIFAEMAIFVGETHAQALGLDGANLLEVFGNYMGQKVDLHTNSKSMLELAYEMDDCPTDALVTRDNLVKRDIKDKKKATAKLKRVQFYVNRLDKQRGTQQYMDYEKKLNRLKQQIMAQNQSSGSSGKLTYEGEKLSEFLLRNMSLTFGEPTDQDNVLEYLQEMEEFECASADGEIEQCYKMLARLSERTDEKSMERIAEFTAKVQLLREQMDFSGLFRTCLMEAQNMLREFHGREIEDGYNLIPKASDLLKRPMRIGGKEISAIELAAIYRDKILCCENFFEVFSAIIDIMSGNSQASYAEE